MTAPPLSARSLAWVAFVCIALLGADAAQRSLLVGGYIPATAASTPVRRAATAARAPRPAAQEVPAQASSPRSPLTIIAVGDMLLDRGVRLLIDRTSPTYPLRHVAPILRNADITFANLECPLTDQWQPTPYKTPEAIRRRKEWVFRGRPSSVEALEAAGVDVVSLANNHVMDHQRVGLRDTMVRLSESEIAWCGAGEDIQEAQTPALIHVRGIRVAFLAFAEADIMPSPKKYEAKDARPGMAIVFSEGGLPAQASLEQVQAAVKRAGALADLVVVSYHWGVECTDQPTKFQRTLAHRTIEFGADLVLGHHPHRLQPLEIYRSKLIAYSLGNFLFNPLREPQKETAILRITFTGRALAKVEAIPVYIRDACPEVVTRADTARRRRIARRLGITR